MGKGLTLDAANPELVRWFAVAACTSGPAPWPLDSPPPLLCPGGGARPTHSSHVSGIRSGRDTLATRTFLPFKPLKSSTGGAGNCFENMQGADDAVPGEHAGHVQVTIPEVSELQTPNPQQ